MHFFIISFNEKIFFIFSKKVLTNSNRFIGLYDQLYYTTFRKRLQQKTSDIFTSEVLVGVAGFEPTHDRVKVCCLTAWPYPSKTIACYTEKSPKYRTFLKEAPPRFELGIRVLQTHALPLGYSAVIGADYEARTRYLHLGKVALYQMS